MWSTSVFHQEWWTCGGHDSWRIVSRRRDFHGGRSTRKYHSHTGTNAFKNRIPNFHILTPYDEFSIFSHFPIVRYEPTFHKRLGTNETCRCLMYSICHFSPLRTDRIFIELVVGKSLMFGVILRGISCLILTNYKPNMQCSLYSRNDYCIKPQI